MSDYIIYIILGIVALILLWFIFTKVLKNKKPQNKHLDLPFKIDDLITALGSKQNIKETIARGSKLTVFVDNDALVEIEKLQVLGASGIIQSTGKVTMIMGKFSKEISDAINDY